MSPHPPFFFPSFLCRNGKRSRLKSGCQALNTHWGSRRSCQPPFSKPGGCWEGVVGRAVLPAPPLRHHQHYKPGEGHGRGLGGGWGKGVPCGSGSQTAEKPALLPRSQESKTNCGSEGRRGEPGAGRWHCPAGAPAFGISVCPGYHLPKQPWTRGGFGPLRIGIQELLRTSHFGDADGPPCSLLPALQGLISGCLMARACCASAKCLCPVFLSCSPGSKGEGMLPCLGMKEAQVSALESKLTVDTFYLC